MANPFQQRSLQRKLVYLALIVALFTGSLLHRAALEGQAKSLHLLERSLGEAELTSSFVRHSLIGSRALATTILWNTAIERMAKHEWNELELLVGAISKLQPYFITPWVFQSWNLAFNVAVECDRPHDKYYYVSRGLELLAEGERRNSPRTPDVIGPDRPRFPGQPEMRHYMGFYLQLKIGNSDEKMTMRSLLDLSCIDPIKRNPKRFWIGDARQINQKELAQFCKENPRLIRRLREHLAGYDRPEQIVRFLEANQDVPSRFKSALNPDQKASELQARDKQFPILPPVEPRPERPETGPAWPNAQQPDYSAESVDVFLICRTWYQYAQEPLPPPMENPGVKEKEDEFTLRMDRDRKAGYVYRLPKTMATHIFRCYPARAQAFMAETLEAEGWFDEDGWAIKGWFDQGGNMLDLRVGTEGKYHARPAWQHAYNMYLEIGRANGMYIYPAQRAELEAKVQAIRRDLKLGSFQPPPQRGELRTRYGEAFDAQQKLAANSQLRTMTNYDAHLYQAEGEKDARAVLARKLLYQAGRYNRKDQQEALPLYERAWPIWVELSLRYPRFAQTPYVHEDVYESMLRAMKLAQMHHPQLFRTAMLSAAPMAIAPHWFWPCPVNWNWARWPYWEAAAKDGPKDGPETPMIDPNVKAKLVDVVRVSRGPLDQVMYIDSSETTASRDSAFALTFVASRLGQLTFTPPVPLPDQQTFAMAGAVTERFELPPPGWRYLIDDFTVGQVRVRRGLMAQPTMAGSQPPPAPAPVKPPAPVK
jgi:hypothetical protein